LCSPRGCWTMFTAIRVVADWTRDRRGWRYRAIRCVGEPQQRVVERARASDQLHHASSRHCRGRFVEVELDVCVLGLLLQLGVAGRRLASTSRVDDVQVSDGESRRENLGQSQASSNPAGAARAVTARGGPLPPLEITSRKRSF
jgi:hypothetical protein